MQPEGHVVLKFHSIAVQRQGAVQRAASRAHSLGIFTKSLSRIRRKEETRRETGKAQSSKLKKTSKIFKAIQYRLHLLSILNETYSNAMEVSCFPSEHLKSSHLKSA